MTATGQSIAAASRDSRWHVAVSHVVTVRLREQRPQPHQRQRMQRDPVAGRHRGHAVSTGPWPTRPQSGIGPVGQRQLTQSQSKANEDRRARGGLLPGIALGEVDTGPVPDRNVLGGPLEPCGTDPLTGFYRDGCCSTGPEDLGRHTICAVVTEEFLTHQRIIGNDLSTPVALFHFPGLRPGDRWCVTAVNWLRAYTDGCAAPVVLAATHERTLQVVPLEALREHAVDVPDNLSDL